MGLLLNLTTADKPGPAPAPLPARAPSTKQPTDFQSKPKRFDSKAAESGPQRAALPARAGGPAFISSSLFTANPAIPKITSEPVEIQPEDIFDTKSFDTLAISSNIKGNLKTEFKCEVMTKVQKRAIPVILQKRDTQIKSPTGSGKTLAYAIPTLQFLQSINPPIGRTDGLYAVIVLPTRELVLQTYNVINKLCRAHVRIVPGMLMGGEKKKSEKARLRKGVNILISTPGRLADHLNTTCCLSFQRTQILVLDEADKLVEMGFLKDVKYIVNKVAEGKTIRHQTILLSATINKGVEELQELSLRDPVFVELGGSNVEIDYKIPDQLKQHFIILPTKLRLVTLLSFILDKRNKKCIIFLSCKDSVEFHYELSSVVFAKYCEHEKLNLFKLHGSMEQSDRTPVYQKFSTCTKGLLFTTDVAARGLDMPAIDWIVQYDCPGPVKDYVHRVGRTARAGQSGKSLLLLNPHESGYIEVLQKQQINIKQVKYEKCMEKLKQFTGSRRNEDAASSVQTFVEQHCRSRESKGVAIRAFQSYVRAYSSTQFKECFNFKDLHLGHVAKIFGLTDTPSTFLHKNLSRKKQVEARKENLFERKEKRHPEDGKRKKKKRKLNLVSDEDIKGLAVLSGPKPKRDKT